MNGMKKILFALSVFCLITTLNSEARADLDQVLADITTLARSDKNRYEARLSSHFDLPLSHVQRTIREIGSSTDAFMCLQLSMMTGHDLDRVIGTYKKNRGKGWGVTAKELGIKPGSAEFHALKRGDFGFVTGSGNGPANGKKKGKKQKDKKKGNGKGKGKGHQK